MENIDTVFIALILCTLMGMFATYKWYIWKRKWYKLMKEFNEIRFKELKRTNKDILKLKNDKECEFFNECIDSSKKFDCPYN